MMTNRERLNDAYKVERKLGYPWHQICIYLKEIHMSLDAVLKDDTLTEWTIHHKLFTDDNVELYKTDKDVLHYSIMHYQCHAMCHRILKESMNKDEIKSLTFMGRAWIVSSLKRFL